MKMMMRDIWGRAQKFGLALKPSVYTLLIMAGATLLSGALYRFFIQTNNVSIIYALAVVVVACITPGYFYGIAASLISVFGVNYFFTAPYWKLNFTLTGYPITFFMLLVASIITSTLVTGYRERDRAKNEAETEKLRSNLLRAISHDLRTPLTSISGASAALLENGAEIDTSDKAALLTDIHDNAEWLIRMVENLLSVTRIQGDGTPIQKTPEMAEEVLAQAVAQIRHRFPKQRLTVTAPELPLTVPMDGTLIGQVLINLIENAIYHSGSSEPIQIKVERKGDKAVCSVRDHGKGIDAAYIRRMLDGHIDASRANDGNRGMGIGLSICAAIIRAHGGDITARNRPDGGAIFSFFLPMEDCAQDCDDDAEQDYS